MTPNKLATVYFVLVMTLIGTIFYKTREGK